VDDYTKKTRDWLEKRFRQVDENGIYYAHQPIYGFRKGHCDPGPLNRFIATYHILKTLSHIEFNSLLDVGGAEGYTAFLVRELFHAKVKTSDLSLEACKRTKEIFSIDSQPADIHNLPYKDNAFDVVLSSETLEHVTDVRRATHELLRVCKKALVITVPYEPQETIDQNIREKTPHAHIHGFDLNTFNFLKSEGYRIFSRKIRSSYLKIPFLLVEALPGTVAFHLGKRMYPKIFLHSYILVIPILQKIFGKKTAAFLVHLDNFIAQSLSLYNGILFLILREENCHTKNKRKSISVRRIMDLVVPYHYLPDTH
jgi:SAM-dependent methyltransferase